MMRLNRLERPAATPSGMPIAIDMPTAASTRASVCMASAHSPDSANVVKATSAQTPARRPPKRQARSVPLTTTPIQVSQTRRSLNHSTRLSAKTRKPSNTVNRRPPSPSRRLSISQVWIESNRDWSPFQTSSCGQAYSPRQPR